MSIDGDGSFMTNGQSTVRARAGQPVLAPAAAPGQARGGWRPARAAGRQRAKRERIIAVAMEHFASRGYEGTRADEIAAAAGVSKGAVFGYFGGKAGLFLAAYQAATRSFSRYLDAPPEVLSQGFFATIRYWLDATPHMIGEDWVPYRVALIGGYCTDLALKREDPYGTRDFVRFGVERGEVRCDIELDLIVSAVDWMVERCQDAIVTEELDPGLFGYFSQSAELRERRVRQFVELLRSAISPPPGAPGPGGREPSPPAPEGAR